MVVARQVLSHAILVLSRHLAVLCYPRCCAICGAMHPWCYPTPPTVLCYRGAIPRYPRYLVIRVLCYPPCYPCYLRCVLSGAIPCYPLAVIHYLRCYAIRGAMFHGAIPYYISCAVHCYPCYPRCYPSTHGVVLSAVLCYPIRIRSTVAVFVTQIVAIHCVNVVIVCSLRITLHPSSAVPSLARRHDR